MKSYKLVGLTGTTGAGKGQVSQIFKENGYEIIDADLLAREAVKNPLVLKLLASNFGEDIISNGKLNRGLLGKRAFETKEKTALLNSITHPFISALFTEKVANCVRNGKDKIIFDAPQLFESKLNIFCDMVVAVTADENLRIARIMARDNISQQEAIKRVAVQYSAEFFKENSDYVIENNSDLECLKEKTLEIIEKI